MAIDSIGQWLNAAGRVPLLTHREELLLGRAVQAWQQWPGGADAAPAPVRRRGLRARERMVCANLRLVVSVAKRYGRYAVLRQVAQEDLLQAGAIGLQRAAEKFDPSSGYKFSTYATWWIRQALPREIWRGGMVRIPQNVGEQIQRLQESDIATLSASQRATLAAAQATLSVAALDAPAGGEDHCALADLIAADGADPFIQIEAERLATAAPEAWAAGLKAINRRGLDSAPGRAILKKLRAAVAG